MPSPTPAGLPPHPDVTILSEARVWDGRFPLDTVRFRHRRFDGTQSGDRTWELWRRGRAAAVLPYDPNTDAVVLIEQFRLPALAAGLAPVLVEVPAGLCDPGEDATATARREMQEEVDLAVRRLERIGDFLLTPGGSDEYTTLFVGEIRAPAAGPGGIAGVSGLAAEHEDIRARVWPAPQAIESALAGEFPNALTALALFWLAGRRDGLRTRWLRE